MVGFYVDLKAVQVLDSFCRDLMKFCENFFVCSRFYVFSGSDSD